MVETGFRTRFDRARDTCLTLPAENTSSGNFVGS